MNGHMTIDVKMWLSKESKEAEILILNGIPWKGYAAFKALEYARKILKGRWEKGEQLILGGDGNPSAHSLAAYRYAKFVIGGRWKEAEPIIAKCANSSWLYSKYVLKDRFPEFENHIESNKNKKSLWPFYNQEDLVNYAIRFYKKRLPKRLEKTIAKSRSAAKYAAAFMKKRWLAAEDEILRDIQHIETYLRSLQSVNDRRKFRVKLLAQALKENGQVAGHGCGYQYTQANGWWNKPASAWIEKNEASENPVTF